MLQNCFSGQVSEEGKDGCELSSDVTESVLAEEI